MPNFDNNTNNDLHVCCHALVNNEIDQTEASNKIIELLRSGYDITELNKVIQKLVVMGNGPIHFFAQYNCSQVLEAIIPQLDPDALNKTNGYGQTPLHVAALYQSKDAFNTLINQGYDLTAQDNQRYMPVDYLDENWTQLLSQSNCLIMEANRLSHDGKRPIHKMFDNPQIDPDQRTQQLSKLMKNGARITATDQQGKTLFHYTAATGNTYIFNQALQYLSNTEVKQLLAVRDNDNQTPFQIASQYKNYRFINNLINNVDIILSTDWLTIGSEKHYAKNDIDDFIENIKSNILI